MKQLECKDCPVKRLCDCGVKPKSCEKANPKQTKTDKETLDMLNTLFGGFKK